MYKNGKLSSLNRSETIQDLKTITFDVIVIGGGISGAGIAREAALSGLRVALVERGDFASGISSKSTKLIHGGLRYLAMGDVAFVRRMLKDRQAIQSMAPHLVRPMWMNVPTDSWMSMVKLRCGVFIYEKLGGIQKSDRHAPFTKGNFPLKQKILGGKYKYGCKYREYRTNDARLVLSVLRSAVEANVIAINYCSAERFIYEKDLVKGIGVRCRLTNESCEVNGKVIVNATGPWVSDLMTLDTLDIYERGLVFSKGVHVAFKKETLPIQEAMMLEEPESKRFIFLIPSHKHVYVGTTDKQVDKASEDLLQADVSESEINYLLTVLEKYFKHLVLSRKDVVFAWSGVRPLLRQDFKLLSQISRKNEVWTSASGLISILGGKLTGFRYLSKEVLKVIYGQLKQHIPDYVSEKKLINGRFTDDLEVLVKDVVEKYQLEEKEAEIFVELYGAEVNEVFSLGSERVLSEESVCVFDGEIHWHIENESAQTLEDMFYRRLCLPFRVDIQYMKELLQPIGKLMSELLNWGDLRLQQEVSSMHLRLENDTHFW